MLGAKDVETAQDLIELHVGEAKEISDVDPEDLIEVVSGDSLKFLELAPKSTMTISIISQSGSLKTGFYLCIQTKIK